MIRFVLSLALILAPAFAWGQEPDFSDKGRGYVPLTPEKREFFQRQSHAQHNGRVKMMAKNQVLPPAFDAREKVPLPTWNQGSCGSCYLDSTVRTATTALLQKGWGKPDDSFKLAVQYGMDRPRNFGGCNGGNGSEVIDWMTKHGWPAEKYIDQDGTVHNDYPPYEARSGSDRTKPGAKLWMKDASWGYVNASGHPSTDEIKAALFNFGRLNCALDAGGQFGNGTATITALGRSINHEINIVGYDDAKDGGCFILENQWGNSWGTNGCRYVTYKAAANITDIFFVSATPLPPIPPTPPTPGTFTPPYFAMAIGFIKGPFDGIPEATVVAQVQANVCQCAVTVNDSKVALVATVQPSLPPVPPSPVGDQIVVGKAGTYQLISPKTADALRDSGLTIDEYVQAAEAFRGAFGKRNLQPLPMGPVVPPVQTPEPPVVKPNAPDPLKKAIADAYAKDTGKKELPALIAVLRVTLHDLSSPVPGMEKTVEELTADLGKRRIRDVGYSLPAVCRVIGDELTAALPASGRLTDSRRQYCVTEVRAIIEALEELKNAP